ncbi:MAG: c-type cytochrome [Xenococcaceae cyanobacterium MO_188.B19]|nr:c-type cytochrome [Xenococcaceae cyanobacterium MO_188.B19]
MFKKIFLALFACMTLAFASFSGTALAGDAASGAGVFNANCAACHAGGNNVVNAAKTLKIDALKANDKYSIDAIKTQVTNGNGAMPAFGGKLTAEQIEDVATYVLSQADSGW